MRLALLFVFILLAQPARGETSLSDAVRSFDEANRLFAAGEYAAAVESYEQTLAAGYGSAALFYNLGNAYYRLDEIGWAVLAYERARRMAPDDPQILHNLSITRERTVDRFSRIPDPFWESWWQAFSGLMGPWSLFMLGGVFYLAATAFILYRILAQRRNPWLRRSLSLSVLLAIFFICSSFAASLQAQWNRSAVVIDDRLALYKEPANDADIEVTVHEGLLVDLLGARDEWLLLRLPNGVRGWAPSNSVAEIRTSWN